MIIGLAAGLALATVGSATAQTGYAFCHATWGNDSRGNGGHAVITEIFGFESGSTDKQPAFEKAWREYIRSTTQANGPTVFICNLDSYDLKSAQKRRAAEVAFYQSLGRAIQSVTWSPN